VRKLVSLSLLAVLALSLGVILGVFGAADGDGCSSCAGQSCTFLCSSCACCAGALAGVVVPELGSAPRSVALAPHHAARPTERAPRAILHVPRVA
jgi:hypothetical protein